MLYRTQHIFTLNYVTLPSLHLFTFTVLKRPFCFCSIIIYFICKLSIFFSHTCHKKYTFLTVCLYVLYSLYHIGGVMIVLFDLHAEKSGFDSLSSKAKDLNKTDICLICANYITLRNKRVKTGRFGVSKYSQIV